MNVKTGFATAQKRSVESLRLLNFEQERINIHSEALIVANHSGDVCYFNAAAAELTGCSADELLGQPVVSFLTIVNEVTRCQVQDPIVRCLLLNSTIVFGNHDVLVTQYGMEIPIGGSATPLRDGQGEPVGVLLLLRDVSPTRLLLQRISYQS